MNKNNTNNQYHTCAYCNKEYIANEPSSHIIPRQFFKRFKTGINNKEAYSTYHKRLTQRDPKEYLLCSNCEQVFSKWESEFAKRVTNNLYKEQLPDFLVINKKVRLAALSILWRIMHCWAVSNDSKKGTLNCSDIEHLKNYEKTWFDILQEQRDFSREEANIFIIPMVCIKSVNETIEDYKKYPGIMSNIVFYNQGNGKGYYCVRCLVHKVVIFAYLTKAFTCPYNFSIHNEIIQLNEEIMPSPIVDIFIDYANDAIQINI